MVALAISSLVLASIVGVYAAVSRSYTTQNVAADVQQVVRATVDYMAEDIMMVGINPNEIANVGFQEASSGRVRFTADRDMDGDTDDAFEDITYEIGGNQLQQTDHLGTQILLAKLDEGQSAFVYLDEDGDTLGDPVADLTDIRSVVITLTVSEPAGRSKMVNRTYSTRIRCRNIGL
jgi:Tfp pilus assembly protein PilW